MNHTNHDITAPIISSEERQLRRLLGWVLRGRHVYTLRAELYARGWVWDSGAGGMIAPSEEEWKEWAPPPVIDGDVVIKSGGRYCLWPIRCVPSKYLMWLTTSQMATEKEKVAAKAEVAKRHQATRATTDTSYDEDRQREIDRRLRWWQTLTEETKRLYESRHPGRSAVQIAILAYEDHHRKEAGA